MIIGQNVANATEVRDHIIDTLRRELVGPSGGYPVVQTNREEILRPQDPPRYRYACGILFPRGVTYSGSLGATEEESGIDLAEPVTEENAPAAADEESSERDTDGDVPDPITGGDTTPEVDTEMNAASMFLPSTMGVSFLADVSGGLQIEAKWGTYQKESVDGYPGVIGSQKNAKLWFRKPGRSSVQLDAQQSTKARFRQKISPKEASGELVLDVVSRPWRKGQRLVTVTLVNATADINPINESCFFQCEFSVFPLGSSVVQPYPGRPEALQDSEERSLSLLYRHRPNYAVGHGCSAEWTIKEGAVKEVRTEVLPIFEQLPILPRESIDGAGLSMKGLSESSTPEILAACKALASAYRDWINDRAQELSSLTTLAPELKEAGGRHLDLCRQCLGRIEDGINLLGADENLIEAFRLMNRAMVEQREHYSLSVSARGWTEGDDGSALPEKPYVQPVYSAETKWRPFQLAFILMNIRAFVDPTHADRALVDVIWFPTGGGKTEAYLGLAAFVVLLRRLGNPTNAGTTTIMRYTLRLLTTQQFQRAASLICALEQIRRRSPERFGAAPISIGLWVGGTVTPNRHSLAVTELGRLMLEGGENPFIVLACPWCGVGMGSQPFGAKTRVFGYRRQKRDGLDDRVQFRCEDPNCAFSTDEGLPLEVVDDAIYERPPTLVIGTVDKFAMMPWEPRSRRLFGIDNAEAATPPSLIIQDELHLISGPLGSMVGHYETVIDEFSTESGTGIPAKIVASTATIARASDQIRAVYGRQSGLFPPQGLVAGESFFAREGSETAGRTYVGVLATALPSHVTAQVRTLAALLQAPALAVGSDDAIDPYWTLMVYFNSLRELGRASTLVQADIREYLNSVWDRIGLTEGIMPGQAKQLRRFINNFDELTGRMRSADIPAVLQKLFTGRPSRETVDLCYATNMIQVGLDVPRLSVMSIVGQPKGASEYIQASSRVGRSAGKPGLVVTNYNPFKPRDRSHFESFRSFHENAYRHVEPTSVTPFSIPVCERAIHALAVSVARFYFPELRDSPTRGIEARRKAISDIVLRRVAYVAPDEVDRARTILDSFLDDWERRRPQFYGDMGGNATDPLMWPAGKPLRPDIMNLAPFIRSTPSSMRNVDAECQAVPMGNYAVGSDR
jgi:Helicase conserved C-terminal domain